MGRSTNLTSHGRGHTSFGASGSHTPSAWQAEMTNRNIASQTQRVGEHGEIVSALNSHLQELRRAGKDVSTVPGINGADGMISGQIGPKDAVAVQKELDRIGGVTGRPQSQPFGPVVQTAAAAPLAAKDVIGAKPGVSFGASASPKPGMTIAASGSPAAAAAPTDAIPASNGALQSMTPTGAGYVATAQSASGPRTVNVSPSVPSMIGAVRARNPTYDASAPAQKAAMVRAFSGQPSGSSGGVVTGSETVYDPNANLKTIAAGDSRLPAGAVRGVEVDPKYQTPGASPVGFAGWPEKMQTPLPAGSAALGFPASNGKVAQAEPLSPQDMTPGTAQPKIAQAQPLTAAEMNPQAQKPDFIPSSNPPPKDPKRPSFIPGGSGDPGQREDWLSKALNPA